MSGASKPSPASPSNPGAAVPPPTPAFEALLRELGVELDANDRALLHAYLGRLYAANERFNLTAIRDPAEAWTKHVADALTLVPFLEGLEARAVIDVGSGAGLPGMVLAVVMPAIVPGFRMTLLEATGKKARFLAETAAALGLAHVTVVNERAETVGRNHRGLRERFDAAVCRALGPLPVALELCIPLVRTGGVVLAVKGERAAEEIVEAEEALRLLRAEVRGTTRTPTGTIVTIEKMATTARLYPRLPGEPKRQPLARRRG